MLLGLCGAVLDIAFDHQSLNELFNIGVLIAAVNDILGDTYLLEIFLMEV